MSTSKRRCLYLLQDDVLSSREEQGDGFVASSHYSSPPAHAEVLKLESRKTRIRKEIGAGDAASSVMKAIGISFRVNTKSC